MEHLPDFSAASIDRLIHSLSGEATPTEREVVDQWRAAHSAHQALADQLQTTRAAARHGAQAALPMAMADQWIHAVQARISAGEQNSFPSARMNDRSKQAMRSRRVLGGINSLQRWPAALKMAAGVAVGMAVVLGVFGRTTGRRLFPETRSYATAAGENAVVTLRNGARVTLAPRTTLTTRGADMTVSGEAFFEVTHRSAEPLLVHVGAATVRVLGTAFAVRHYANDRDVEVAVTEGRVGLVAPMLRSAVTLTAGRAAQVHDSTLSLHSVDDRSTYTDWTTHQLVFQQAPVPDVLAALGRWYGYQFRLTDSTLAMQHMSAAFDGRSIAGTLALLKTTLDVTLTFDDTVVTLQPRNHPAQSKRDTRHDVHEAYSTSHEVGR